MIRNGSAGDQVCTAFVKCLSVLSGEFKSHIKSISTSISSECVSSEIVSSLQIVSGLEIVSSLNLLRSQLPYVECISGFHNNLFRFLLEKTRFCVFENASFLRSKYENLC